ncbi:hypothetical protein FNV43_RR17335 [Rhamnella rubrinervis]|uniref:Uncharacterized protein n=1 Tax=Rhamnella rubrinervis TaxID=2594499 RepID=A0A8K0GXV1_9ROSA|nr:hypothetical protein FNV43_RR17335 [Rhamnella rubrinervis]
MGGPSSECSSSGEEDGDAQWKAAIDSIAATSSFVTSNNDASPKPPVASVSNDSQQLKHYQIKAQKILDDILEKTLVMVKDPIDVPDVDPMNGEGSIRLFKHAPPGIVFDHNCELQQPRKRPKLLPGKEFDEKSKEFRRRLNSVAVDGKDMMAAARGTYQKSLARLEAKHAAAKAAANKEEERVGFVVLVPSLVCSPSFSRKMVNVFEMVLDGWELFTRTIWTLQERRFFTAFDAARSVAVSVTMAFAFCFLTIHRYRQPRAEAAFI